MLRGVPPPTTEAQESNNNRFLFYLVGAIGSQLRVLLNNHPSLAQNSDFTSLYEHILDFYEGTEGGGENIGRMDVPMNSETTVSAGYEHVLTRLDERSDITIGKVEELYNFAVKELQRIITDEVVRRKSVSPIGEAVLKLPPLCAQSFEQFRDSVDKDTSREFFEEAICAAADSIVFGEIEGPDKIITSMSEEVLDLVYTIIESALEQYEKSDDSDVDIVPETIEADEEMLRLMLLTDEKLAQETTWLDQIVKEAIIDYRRDVKAGFGYGQSPDDPDIRKEWTARITIKPRPKLTILDGGKKATERPDTPTIPDTSSKSGDGSRDRLSVRGAA